MNPPKNANNIIIKNHTSRPNNLYNVICEPCTVPSNTPTTPIGNCDIIVPSEPIKALIPE